MGLFLVLWNKLKYILVVVKILFISRLTVVNIEVLICLREKGQKHVGKNDWESVSTPAITRAIGAELN